MKKTKEIATWYKCTVQKEQLYLRNIYSDVDRKKFENSSTLKNYYKAFDYFLHIVALLNKYCNKISNIEDVDHDVMATFLDRTLNLKYNYFS